MLTFCAMRPVFWSLAGFGKSSLNASTNSTHLIGHQVLKTPLTEPNSDHLAQTAPNRLPPTDYV